MLFTWHLRVLIARCRFEIVDAEGKSHLFEADSRDEATGWVDIIQSFHDHDTIEVRLGW